MNAFFSVIGHVKGDAALPLSIVENCVHFTEANHLPMGTEEGIVGLDVGEGISGEVE